MSKNVLFVAPCLTTSGYGVHSRQIAKYLIEKHKKGKIKLTIKAVPWGQTPWILDENSHDGLIGDIMRCTGDITTKPDVTIQNVLPNEWQPLGNINIGITAGIETDLCNPKWIEHVNSMSHVIVPSKFTKKVFTDTAALNGSTPLTTKIHVVNESYNEYIDKTNKGLDLDIKTPFNFLIFGQITAKTVASDRKNTFNTLKWLFEEFKDDDDVGIVLKTNSGRQTIIDKKVTTNMMKQLISEVRKTEFPKLHILHGPMSDKDVAMLYKDKSIKALVTATRGEGYGLPILEAAASGLPVIATDWSGHLDFMRSGKYIKLDYALQNIPNERVDNNLFMQGAKWAEVKEDDFKKKVRKFKNSSKLPQQWANDLSEVLKEKFSFDEISQEYDKLLGDML